MYSCLGYKQGLQWIRIYMYAHSYSNTYHNVTAIYFAGFNILWFLWCTEQSACKLTVSGIYTAIHHVYNSTSDNNWAPMWPAEWKLAACFCKKSKNELKTYWIKICFPHNNYSAQINIPTDSFVHVVYWNLKFVLCLCSKYFVSYAWVLMCDSVKIS